MILLMFDIDGTLVNSMDIDRELFGRAVREALGSFEFSTDWQHYPHVTNTGILNTISRENVGRIPSPDERSAIEARLLELFETTCVGPLQLRATPGARQFMSEVRSLEDCVVSFATGCWTTTARFKLRSAGFDIDDAIIASSSDCEARTDIMETSERRSLERMGVPRFDHVIYFGDGLWDMKASRALGYGFVGVDNPVLEDMSSAPLEEGKNALREEGTIAFREEGTIAFREEGTIATSEVAIAAPFHFVKCFSDITDPAGFIQDVVERHGNV